MPTAAYLSLSVDLTIPGDSLATSAVGDWSEAAAALLELTGRHRLPATWASVQPAQEGFRRLTQRVPADHEIALLVDAEWASSPQVLTRELRRRTDEAQQAGMSVTTLALRDAAVRDPAHLMLAAGLSQLRTAGSPSARLAGAFPEPVFRQGICRITTTARIPARQGWGWNLTGGSAVRLLQAAVEQQAPLHLTIDDQRLLRGGKTALRQLERFIVAAAEARQEGLLDIGTLADAARRYRPAAPRRQARSILRAA